MSKKADNTAVQHSRKFILLLFTAAAAAFLLRLFAAYEMGGINGGINSVFTPSKATDLCTYMVPCGFFMMYCHSSAPTVVCRG